MTYQVKRGEWKSVASYQGAMPGELVVVTDLHAVVRWDAHMRTWVGVSGLELFTQAMNGELVLNELVRKRSVLCYKPAGANTSFRPVQGSHLRVMSLVFAPGELVLDLDFETVRVGDGKILGGWELTPFPDPLSVSVYIDELVPCPTCGGRGKFECVCTDGVYTLQCTSCAVFVHVPAPALASDVCAAWNAHAKERMMAEEKKSPFPAKCQAKFPALDVFAQLGPDVTEDALREFLRSHGIEPEFVSKSATSDAEGLFVIKAKGLPQTAIAPFGMILAVPASSSASPASSPASPAGTQTSKDFMIIHPQVFITFYDMLATPVEAEVIPPADATSKSIDGGVLG